MGIGRLAGRLFDPNRLADDITTPYPENPAAERALVARGPNVVSNDLAARRPGLRSPEEANGKHYERSWEVEYGGMLRLPTSAEKRGGGGCCRQGIWMGRPTAKKKQ